MTEARRAGGRPRPGVCRSPRIDPSAPARRSDSDAGGRRRPPTPRRRHTTPDRPDRRAPAGRRGPAPCRPSRCCGRAQSPCARRARTRRAPPTDVAGAARQKNPHRRAPSSSVPARRASARPCCVQAGSRQAKLPIRCPRSVPPVVERDHAVLADLEHRAESAGRHRGGRPRAFDGQVRVRLRRLGVQQDRADREQPSAAIHDRRAVESARGGEHAGSRSRRRCGRAAGAAAAPRVGIRRRRYGARTSSRSAGATSCDSDAPASRSTTNSAPSRASARSSAVWNSRSASAALPTAARPHLVLGLQVEQVPVRRCGTLKICAPRRTP